MLGELVQLVALQSPDPLAGFIAAERIWPLDHEFRQTVTEWVLQFPSPQREALDGLNVVLANDPYSADARSGRIAYELALRQDAAALADWRFLARLVPQARVVKAVKNEVARRQTPSLPLSRVKH